LYDCTAPRITQLEKEAIEHGALEDGELEDRLKANAEKAKGTKTANDDKPAVTKVANGKKPAGGKKKARQPVRRTAVDFDKGQPAEQDDT